MLLPFFLASAWASSTYPLEIETLAEMPCLPTCVLCHETNVGGAGTVTREFGLALIDRGLTGGGQLELLGTAFDTLVADAVDSDGDGTTDADELAAGDDPNPDGAAFCGTEAPITPEYGCFNSAQSPMSALAVLGGLLGVGLARRRKG